MGRRAVGSLAMTAVVASVLSAFALVVTAELLAQNWARLLSPAAVSQGSVPLVLIGFALSLAGAALVSYEPERRPVEDR